MLSTDQRDAIEIKGQDFTVRHARKEDLAEARVHILRVTEEDIKFPYTPRYHFDVDQPELVYLQNPRHAFFVAVDDASGRIIGTTTIRAGGPTSPPFPSWLADRYDPETTAQLYRVYIARDARRRHVASALVEAARRFVVAEGGYRDLCGHTDPSVEGAEPFWRSVARIVYDGRADTGRSDSVHFELPMHVPLPGFRQQGDGAIDWQQWFWRWERQQSSYIEGRDARFDAMLDVLGALMPERFTAIDLMCGPGAITRRVVERFSQAEVIAVDLDPVLIALGQNAIGDAGGRIRWAEADLRNPSWVNDLGIGQVDAVLSTTAIHWISAGDIVDLYRQLADVIRPGGVLMNGDQMNIAPNKPVLRRISLERREAWHQHATALGAESWAEWWLALRQEPALRELFTERDRRFTWREAQYERNIGSTAYEGGGEPFRHTHFDVHAGALLDAGFNEVDVTWQHLASRLLTAIR